MNSIVEKIRSKLSKKRIIALLVAVILLLFVGSAMARKGETETSAQTSAKRVEALAITDLSSDGGTIPVTGTVQANDQIDLRPQIGGQVAAVRVSLNQLVQPGQILVELNHRDLDAAVAQASAGVQSALAALAKMKNGSRPEDVIIAEQNLESAKQQLLELQKGARPEDLAQAELTVQNAQATFDQTIQQNQINLSNQFENTGQLILSTQFSLDSLLEQNLLSIFDDANQDTFKPAMADVILENQVNAARRTIGSALAAWRQAAPQTGTEDETLRAIDEALSITNDFLRFLDTTLLALQDAVATPSFSSSDITTAIATVHAARTTVKSSTDALIAQKQSIASVKLSNEKALESAQTALAKSKEQLQIVKNGPTPEQIAIQEARVRQAEQQLLIAKNGARPEDVRLQEASVAQARASLALAAANRDKAIVRAPIAGRVMFLDAKIGDVVGGTTIVVSLANQGGMEVETFVTERERLFIEVGGKALIDEAIEGTVSEISPALEPTTKKIKVMVAIASQETPLTLGQSVSVELSKKAAEGGVTLLPLSAVKLREENALVYRIVEGVLVEQEVQVGEVSGNYVEVMTPFEQETLIVKDARGLRGGQAVEIR